MEGIKRIFKESKLMYILLFFIVTINIVVQLVVNQFVNEKIEEPVVLILILVFSVVFIGLSGAMLGSFNFRIAVLFNANRKKVSKEILIYLMLISALCASIITVTAITVYSNNHMHMTPLLFGYNWNISSHLIEKLGLAVLLVYSIGVLFLWVSSTFMKNGLIKGFTQIFVAGTILVITSPVLYNYMMWGSNMNFSRGILIVFALVFSILSLQNFKKVEIN